MSPLPPPPLIPCGPRLQLAFGVVIPLVALAWSYRNEVLGRLGVCWKHVHSRLLGDGGKPWRAELAAPEADGSVPGAREAV